jgi:hypothetical protein
MGDKDEHLKNAVSRPQETSAELVALINTMIVKKEEITNMVFWHSGEDIMHYMEMYLKRIQDINLLYTALSQAQESAFKIPKRIVDDIKEVKTIEKTIYRYIYSHDVDFYYDNLKGLHAACENPPNAEKDYIRKSTYVLQRLVQAYAFLAENRLLDPCLLRNIDPNKLRNLEQKLTEIESRLN